MDRVTMRAAAAIVLMPVVCGRAGAAVERNIWMNLVASIPVHQDQISLNPGPVTTLGPYGQGATAVTTFEAWGAHAVGSATVAFGSIHLIAEGASTTVAGTFSGAGGNVNAYWEDTITVTGPYPDGTLVSVVLVAHLDGSAVALPEYAAAHADGTMTIEARGAGVEPGPLGVTHATRYVSSNFGAIGDMDQSVPFLVRIGVPFTFHGEVNATFYCDTGPSTGAISALAVFDALATANAYLVPVTAGITVTSESGATYALPEPAAAAGVMALAVAAGRRRRRGDDGR